MGSLFITFEGVDGSGKSEQALRLYDYLRGLPGAPEVVMTRDPGGTRISEKIRGIILDSENREMADITENLLYAAARAQLVKEVIAPALERGAIVVCDRFLDSGVAYQSAARGLEVETVLQINSFAVKNFKPNLTFLLDIDPEKGLARKKRQQNPDRLEFEKLEFFKRVRESYLETARKNPDRVILIDANKSIEEIHDNIAKTIQKVLVMY